MRKLYIAAIIGISFAAATMVPSAWTFSIDQYLNERECFDTKEFLDRHKAEQEMNRWQNALGDKMAGGNYNGLSDKSLTPTPLTVCVFTNK